MHFPSALFASVLFSYISGVYSDDIVFDNSIPNLETKNAERDLVQRGRSDGAVLEHPRGPWRRQVDAVTLTALNTDVGWPATPTTTDPGLWPLSPKTTSTTDPGLWPLSPKTGSPWTTEIGTLQPAATLEPLDPAIRYTPDPSDVKPPAQTGCPPNNPLNSNPPTVPVFSAAIGFSYGLNYEFLAKNTTASAQIFWYLPVALAHGLDTCADQIVVKFLYPMNTRQTNGFVTTLAKVTIPMQYKDTFAQRICERASAMYGGTNDPGLILPYTLMSLVSTDYIGVADGYVEGANVMVDPGKFCPKPA